MVAACLWEMTELENVLNDPQVSSFGKCQEWSHAPRNIQKGEGALIKKRWHKKY